MKKIATLLLAAVTALATISPAQADWGHRGGGRGDWGHNSGHDWERHSHYRHGGGGRWIGPAAVLAITGLAIGAAYTRPYVEVAPAQPVYVQPPMAPPVSPAAWYFCRSSGQYYPYTNFCPEGWVAVPAR